MNAIERYEALNAKLEKLGWRESGFKRYIKTINDVGFVVKEFTESSLELKLISIIAPRFIEFKIINIEYDELHLLEGYCHQLRHAWDAFNQAATHQVTIEKQARSSPRTDQGTTE
jgi:hypothetical protein